MFQTQAPLRVVPPEIKFHEVLKQLIDSSPYKKSRRPIWEALGISSAAISQYTKGEARPRYEVMVAIASFFGVSLDYLLLGKDAVKEIKPVDTDAKPFVRYVDWALADVQSRVAYHDWLVGRIGRRLAARIDEVAKELNVDEHFAGVITIDDQIVLEQYSLRTKVVCRDLESDLILTNKGEIAAGRFMHVIANNLKSQIPSQYDFLLLPNRPAAAWDEVVHVFRRVLMSELHVPADRLGQCRFLKSRENSLNAAVFYQPDVLAVQRHEPLLWDALHPYTSDSGWVGFTPASNSDMQGDTLFSTEHLIPALSLFDDWWNKALASNGP